MDSFKNKFNRVQRSLSCIEPDRVPKFDLFWEEFTNRWIDEKDLNSNTDIYEYYDMDLIQIIPNTDPKINSYTSVKRGKDYEIFKSGFGCTLKKATYSPMPGYLDFPVKSADEYKDFVLEDPNEKRRYYEPSANILSSAGNKEVPSFNDQLNNYKGKIPAMGLVLEGQEKTWRIRGMDGLFIDLATEKKKVKKFLKRLEEFEIQIGLNQIEMGVDFMMIGGDVAYDKGMFYSPDMWREFFKPFLSNLCKAFKKAKPNIRILYHGCGNASAIFDDLIECGIDAYQALEVKAGLDVIELKKKYKNRLAYVGNIDVRDVLPGSKKEIKQHFLRKLNAAKGGGYIPMADHSVPSSVSANNYDYYISLIEKYGKYPLKLGKFDIPELNNIKQQKE